MLKSSFKYLQTLPHLLFRLIQDFHKNTRCSNDLTWPGQKRHVHWNRPKCGILFLGEILVRMQRLGYNLFNGTLHGNEQAAIFQVLYEISKSEFLKIIASIKFGAIYDSRIRIRWAPFFASSLVRIFELNAKEQ